MSRVGMGEVAVFVLFPLYILKICIYIVVCDYVDQSVHLCGLLEQTVPSYLRPCKIV